MSSSLPHEMHFAYPRLRPGDVPGAEWEGAKLHPAVDRNELDPRLEAAFDPASGQGETRALVVVQGGRLVLERYVEGTNAETTHASWSLAKSMLHAAVGILVREGRIDPGEPADVPAWQGADDPRRRITLEHLLRMQSGLAWREQYDEVEGSDVIEMLFGPGRTDTASYASGKPLAAPPGTVFSYASGTSNILSRIMARRLGVSGEGYRAFLERELFGPLGMRSAEPGFDEAGTWVGSSLVSATARDLARFGLLYLRDGVWNERRILPEGWVDHARRPACPDPNSGLGYGAHWWVVPGLHGLMRASGFNGQRILIAPALDLVLVRLGATPADRAPALDAFCVELIERLASGA